MSAFKSNKLQKILKHAFFYKRVQRAKGSTLLHLSSDVLRMRGWSFLSNVPSSSQN